MKILFCNMLDQNYVKGHKNLDEKMMEYISNFSELHVLAPLGWYERIPYNVEKNNRLYYIDNRNLLGHRYALDVLNKVKELDLMYKFDYILFESFDTVVSINAIMKFKQYSKRIYVMHHNNIDNFEMIKKQKIVFDIYKNRINHIVLGEYIRDHLVVQDEVRIDKVFSIPHPLDNMLLTIPDNRIYDCVGISSSNDEKWIEEIINLEKNNSWFQTKELRAVFKSQKHSFDNGYLKVIKGFIPDNEYNDYYANAKQVFLPFPTYFKYRMSGSLVDSLSNKSVVIGTAIPVFEWYAKEYPTICKTVNSMNELLDLIEKEKCLDYVEAFDKFKVDHSDLVIENLLKKCFKEGKK